jgi:hypothetical protein
MPPISPPVMPPILPPPVPQQPEIIAPTPIGDDAAMRMIMPVGRAWQAIVSGYMGLLSILPCFGVLAIFFGIWAVSVIRKDPKRHGMVRSIFGIIAGVLGTILWTVIFIEAQPYRGRY